MSSSIDLLGLDSDEKYLRPGAIVRSKAVEICQLEVNGFLMNHAISSCFALTVGAGDNKQMGIDTAQLD